MGGSQKPRLIVGLSGSSGLPYGIRLLEVLRKLGTEEVHLILTDAAKLNISVETDWRVKDVEALADVVHNVMNISASIASAWGWFCAASWVTISAASALRPAPDSCTACCSIG